jgi:hypothetical protein
MTGRYYFESPQDVAIANHSDKWAAHLVTLRPAQ